MLMVPADRSRESLWLAWERAPDGYHYAFRDVDGRRLTLKGLGGVYVIWRLGRQPDWVVVGQSDDVGAALARHRGDQLFGALEKKGALFVTWARVEMDLRIGVQRWLADRLNPLIPPPLRRGSDPITVNIPN